MGCWCGRGRCAHLRYSGRVGLGANGRLTSQASQVPPWTPGLPLPPGPDWSSSPSFLLRDILMNEKTPVPYDEQAQVEMGS